MKSLFFFIALLGVSQANKVAEATSLLEKTLGHFRLLDKRDLSPDWKGSQREGSALTFVHKGRGAEHVVDVELSPSEGASMNLHFLGAKSNPVKKTLVFDRDLFVLQNDLYVELVYRMARTKSAPVHFTSLDDLSLALNKLLPRHSITRTKNEKEELVFSVRNQDTPVITLFAKLSVTPKAPKQVSQDFEITLNAKYSNNNLVSTFKQSFSVFSNEEFSKLKSLLGVQHLENLSEVSLGCKAFYEAGKRLSFGPFATLADNSLAAEIDYSGAKVLINLSQSIDKDFLLPRFHVKIGKSNGPGADLALLEAKFSTSFTRLTQTDLETLLKAFNIMSLFDSFDKMILEVYRKVHKETYEAKLIGAALRTPVASALSGIGFSNALGYLKSTISNNNAVTETSEVLETVYNGETIATFEVRDVKGVGMMLFSNEKDHGRFVFELPGHMLSRPVVESYIRALLTENVKVAQKSLKA